MKIKHGFRWLLACTWLVSAIGFVFAQDPGGKIVLRVADSFPAGHYIAEQAVKHWMNQVRQASGGMVDFEYYPAEQLGKAKDLLDLTLAGTIDIGYASPSYISDRFPLSTVAELPGGFTASCTGTLAYWKLARDGVIAQKEMAPLGVRLLVTMAIPGYQLNTRSRFESLKDLEGMKIRTAGGAMDATMRRLKMVPIRIPGPEMYEAASRGTVDGVILPWASVLAYKLDEHVKYTTVGENFSGYIANYIISEARWKKLPERVRKLMWDAGEASTRNACGFADRANEADRDRLKQRGMHFVQLSAADRKQIETQLATVANDWAESLDKRGKPGTEVLKAFRAALAQEGR
ncbi:MAG: Solute-binding protein [Rhodocyclaceae bacterium]|nr:TRAP transporter substrate-binding protein DctP [Rhodocyclaceae bacterium]MCG3187298.1 Solute-binding protein [Rhodocyclaceae bacterium]